MLSMWDRFTESEQEAYIEGVREGRRFKANHGDIYQTLFQAETDSHRLRLIYNDVECGIFLEVVFKHRVDKDGNQKTVTAQGNMERALAFLTRHPHHKPYCSVDY